MKSEKRKKSPAEILKLRRRMESISTLGLILVLIALVAAVFAPDSVKWLLVYKILSAVGAVGSTAARMVNVNDPDDSVRLRRIRRMEVWAGLPSSKYKFSLVQVRIRAAESHSYFSSCQ